MAVILDPQTEQRIQREIDLGHFRDPSELIDYALSLLQEEGDWLTTHKDELDQRIRQGLDQIARGEGLSGEQTIAMLDSRLARHS